MGVYIHRGTMDGGVTPICNECMISLCFDVSDTEYETCKQFWDSWICQECNGDKPFSKLHYAAMQSKLNESNEQ
jgi:hypothetical protein